MVFYLVTLVCAFAAAFLAAQTLLPTPSQMYELRQRSVGRAEVRALSSPILRFLWPLVTLAIPVGRKLGSKDYRARMAHAIPLASLPPIFTVDHLLSLKVVLAVTLPLVLALQFSAVRNPVGVLAVAAIGYFLPDRIVKEQKHAREQKILRAMPGAVDMLTLAVEAGMDFLAALQRVVEKGATGPLREEIATIINDIRLGASRGDALRAFANRINITEVVSFVGVLVQADRLGASIGGVLRSQADRMRTERFQRAEKAGAAASQKLLMPLAVFIFPAVMIVLLGPVVLGFIYGEGFGM